MNIQILLGVIVSSAVALASPQYFSQYRPATPQYYSPYSRAAFTAFNQYEPISPVVKRLQQGSPYAARFAPRAQAYVQPQPQFFQSAPVAAPVSAPVEARSRSLLDEQSTEQDINAPRKISTFPAPEEVVYYNGYNFGKLNQNARNGQIPDIASFQPATDHKKFPIDSRGYALKAFNFPIGITDAIKATRSSSSPNAAAALAYMKEIGSNDICGRSTQLYLEIILRGGSVDEANSAATQIYIDDYNNGLSVVQGSACDASDIAWRQAEKEGKDPVVYSAIAFMENWPGTQDGNPCAVSGRDYVSAVIEGASHTQANLLAAKSFASAIQNLAAKDKELTDPACAAATKAFYNALPNKPSPPNGAAMLAFVDKALNGSFSFKYDPVCWRSTEAFFDSYSKGNDELTSNLASAEVFFDEFARGGSEIPADSPCAASTIAYYQNIQNPPSPPNKAAMEAFMNKMIAGGVREPDPACAASTRGFWQAYKAGATETDANLAGAEAFFRAFSEGLNVAADSPCVAATKAYFYALPNKPSHPNAEAMISFMDAMIEQGNKRVYDPACASATVAFFNSYKAGNDELTSNFEAARAFIQEYKKGAKVPANSPCLISTRVYAANIKNKPSLPNAAAMLAFMEEAILSNMDKPDPVCLASMDAYFNTYLGGSSEAEANEAAGVAFLDAVASTPDFNPGSPCGISAKAYMGRFDLL